MGIAVCIPCWGESVVIVGIGLLVSSSQQGVSNIAQVWPVLESAQQAARRALVMRYCNIVSLGILAHNSGY